MARNLGTDLAAEQSVFGTQLLAWAILRLECGCGRLVIEGNWKHTGLVRLTVALGLEREGNHTNPDRDACAHSREP